MTSVSNADLSNFDAKAVLLSFFTANLCITWHLSLFTASTFTARDAWIRDSLRLRLTFSKEGCYFPLLLSTAFQWVWFLSADFFVIKFEWPFGLNLWICDCFLSRFVYVWWSPWFGSNFGRVCGSSKAPPIATMSSKMTPRENS